MDNVFYDNKYYKNKEGEIAMNKLKIGDIRKFYGCPEWIGVVVSVKKSYYIVLSEKGEFNRVFKGQQNSVVKLESNLRYCLDEIGNYYKEIEKLENNKRKINENLNKVRKNIEDSIRNLKESNIK